MAVKDKGIYDKMNFDEFYRSTIYLLRNEPKYWIKTSEVYDSIVKAKGGDDAKLGMDVAQYKIITTSLEHYEDYITALRS